MKKKEKAEKKQTSLSITAKMGAGLIREAISEYQDMQKKKVVSEVSTIMERISVMERIKEKTDRRLTLLHDQLDAINKGKFEIDERYGIQNRIRFENKDLNVDWSQTEQW